MSSWIILGLSAFLISWFITGKSLRYSIKNQLIDVPGKRTSHSQATPRGGGISIVLTYTIGLLILWFFEIADRQLLMALIIGGTSVAAVGYWDDHKALPAKLRISVHILSAIFTAIVLQVGQIEFAWNTWLPLWLNFPLTIIGIVWMINLYNFMDGIDALAGLEALFVLMVISAIAIISDQPELAAITLLLAAANTGFLIFNFPPARIFMGDVGSGFLGFQFATLAIASEPRYEISVWVWMILLAVFLTDSTLTLLRRMLKGERWYNAHRSHAYQRLSRHWQSHLLVDYAIIAINIFWLALMAILAFLYPNKETIIFLVSLLPLVGIWFKLNKLP